MRLSILRRAIVLICFSVISCTIFAQKSKIDSLNILLPKAKNKKNIFINLCWAYRNIQTDSAEKYGKEALKLAEIQQHDSSLAVANHYLGVIAQSRGITSECLSYYFKVVEIAEKNNFQERLAFVYQGIGRVNQHQGNYSYALSYTNRSLALFERLQSQSGISYCYITLGEIYTKQKSYALGLEYYDKAFIIRKKQNNTDGIGTVYSLIGENLLLQRKYKEAKNFLEDAEKIFIKTENLRSTIIVYNRIAEIYIIEKEWEKALYYSKESEKMAYRTGLTEFIKKSYQNIIDAYIAQEDYVRAYSYQLLLLQHKDSITDIEKQINTQEVEAKYMSAKREQDILLLKKENKNQQNLIYLSIIIFLLMFAVGITFYFNIRQKRNSNHLLLVQQKEIQEKNEALMRLNEEITLQNQEITKQRDEQEKINIFKDKLFSIISHDLRSPLASLSSSLFLFKSKILSDKERNTLIDLLSRDYQATSYLLDNLLNWTRMQMQGLKIDPKMINLTDLVKENFNLLKPQAEKKDISLICNTPESLVVFADLEMVKTVIRNLIHNAIKYTPPKGNILVNSFITADYIITAIQDSGRGMSIEEQKKLFSSEHFSKYGTSNEKGSGLGLLLCKDFIEKNKGTIWVESIENEGSTFSFTLPKSPTIPTNL